MNMTNMPAEPLIFQSGTQSAGLERVNIYFWIFQAIYGIEGINQASCVPCLYQS